MSAPTAAQVEALRQKLTKYYAGPAQQVDDDLIVALCDFWLAAHRAPAQHEESMPATTPTEAGGEDMSHLGRIERLVPYPLRAARISISFTLFPWWKPLFRWNRNLTDAAKRDGETIWYVRWLWLQVSYSRWV